MERHGIGKRLRFEIFKRDEFRCVYCGRGAPLVVLQVDHVVAVKNDGDNNPFNLVTSCFECNSGKSHIPLEILPKTHAETLELEREKLDQLQAVTELSLEKRKLMDGLFVQVSVLWPGGAKAAVEVAIRQYLTKLQIGEVMEAVDLTNVRLARKSEKQRLCYFCGVCNHKVSGKTPRRNSG